MADIEPNTDTLTNSLADRIREDLLAAKLKPGASFMTEAAIAERYGTSRSITREAVSRLRGLGILKSRQRTGLIVSRPDPVHLLSQSMPFLGLADSDFAQLARLRYVLETGAIEMAVIHATDGQIQAMRELVEEWEHCVRDGSMVKRGFEVDAAFHAMILEMSNVPIVAGMHKVIVDYFLMTQWQKPVWPPTMQDNAWQHRAIYDAIANRDLEQARAQLRLHIGYLRDRAVQPRVQEVG